MSGEAENLMVRLAGAKDLDQLAEASDLIGTIAAPEERTRLTATYRQRFAQFSGGDEQPAAETKPAAPAKRTRAAKTSAAAPE